MVIDFHAHHTFEPNFASRLVDLLPSAGIDRICLCSAGEIFGHASNETILKAAEKYPEKITALALVELGRDSPDVVKQYAAQGFRGFKTSDPRSSYDDPAYFPVFEQMEETGMPLLAHTGIVARLDRQRGGDTNSDWMRPICLDAVVRRFPGLNIVGAHLGAPWHEEASMMARIHPNYYVDFTGAYWGGWRANKDAAFFHYHFFWEGAWDKVVFGTDILGLDELLPGKKFHDGLIAKLNLDQDTIAKIYGGTAKRLLRL